MARKKTSAEGRRERLLTAAVVVLLSLIFVGGFLWGLDSVLALEGSFPPNELIEGAAPPPETKAQALRLLTDALDLVRAEKPAVDAAFSLSPDREAENGGVNAPGALGTYLSLLGDTMGDASRPLGKLLKEWEPDRRAGFGEDSRSVLPALSLTPDDVEDFRCDYIYYLCPSCALERETPASSCAECGGARPYEKKYRDDYTVTLTLRGGDVGFRDRSEEEVRELFSGFGEAFRLETFSAEAGEAAVVYRLDRLSLHLRSVVCSRRVQTKVRLAFEGDYASLGAQNVVLCLTERNECRVTWPSLSLNRHELVLEPGSKDNLLATLTCDDPLIYTVAWSCDNEDVVKVDDEGYLTAAKTPGEAKITASFEFGGKTFRDECAVSVRVPAESMRLGKRRLRLKTGKTQTLTAKVSPLNATEKGALWFTEDESVAAVDENGVVTALSPGKTVVYALSKDGWFKSSCEVTVYA